MKPVPTLSLSGWVNEIREKSDRLLSYFFYSDASQSNLYYGNVTSLPDIIKRFGNEKDRIDREMREAMYNYLKRYFDIVDIDVEVTIPDDPTDDRMNLICRIAVGQNGIRYDFSKLVAIENSKIKEIIDRNNGDL